MKRAVSIFLLHIMMLVAIHPVVAMHFCGGKLFSLNLIQDNNDHSCCMVEENHFTQPSETDIDINQASCCHFDTLEISTDEFQNQTNSTIPISLLSSMENNWFTINDLFSLNEPEKNTTCPQDEFPPKGLFMEDICLLAYICIYRI